MIRGSRFGLVGVVGLGVALATAVAARAGGPLAVDTSGQPVGWSPSAPIPYFVDKGALGSLDHATAVALVDAQFGVWGAVPTSTLRYQKSGEIAVDVTVANYGPYLGPYGGSTTPRGQNVIVFDADGSIFDDLYGVGNNILGFAGPAFFSNGATTVPVGGSIPAGSHIVEGLAFLNGRFLDGSSANGEALLADFTGAVLHELGHWSGLDHTQAHGEPFLSETDRPGWNEPFDTMFPTIFFSGGQSTLERDDQVALLRLYPTPGFTGGYGCLSGRVLAADGSPFSGANVIARALANSADAVSTVTGYNPLAPGAYSLCGLLPGTPYRLDVETISPAFTGGSSVGSFSFPIPLPGPPESWSGPRESSDPAVDPPFDFEPLTLAAGEARTGIDVLLDRQAFAVNNFVTGGAGNVALAAGDFDRDGKLDFASVQQNFNPGNRVVLTRGLGGGLFAPPTVLDPSFAGNEDIASGQFNVGGDSFIDLVIASCTLREVRLYRGNGDGTFQPAVDLVPSPGVSFGTCFLVTGDFNGDGSPDLVFVSQENDASTTVDALLGSPAGSFSLVVTHLPAGALAAYNQSSARVTGRFTGSPALGIAYVPTGQSPGALGLLTGDGAGHFAASQIGLGGLVGGRVQALAAGDFDEDGKADLAVVAQTIPGQPVTFLRVFLVLLLGDGAGGFRRTETISVPNDVVGTLVAADFDGDGHLDLAAVGSARDTSPGERALFVLGDGHGGTRRVFPVWGLAAYPPLGLPTGAVAGDFDGDGRLDLLVSDSDVGFGTTDPPNMSVLLARDLGGPETGQSFHTVPPCRIFDSRSPGSGGRLLSGVERLLRIAGNCGVPPSARAVSVNLAVVQPSGAGHLTVYPGNSGVPLTSVMNFGAGQTRSSNAILRLATDGSGSLRALPNVVGKGDLDWVVDVNGYFE